MTEICVQDLVNETKKFIKGVRGYLTVCEKCQSKSDQIYFFETQTENKSH